MAPFTMLPKSPKESCHPQLKPNWVPCIFMHAKQLKKESFYKKWDTNNPPPPSKSILPPPKASSTNGYNQNVPKPWTCNSTGYGIVLTRNNFDISGALDPQTTPTTGQNIIQQRIIGT